MNQNEIKIGTPVRDKSGTWMQVIEITREIATCQYSDGHGIITVSRQISELKEEKE